MDDILYLEVDEEIPSVIEKLRKQPTDDVVLVVPTGAALLSSVVNVKLLKRSAEKEKKRLAVVTTDPIGRHIATQVGVPVYVSVKDRRTFEPPRASAPSVESEEMDLREPDRADDAGVPVHYYNEPKTEPKASGQPQPARAVGFATQSVRSDPPPMPEPFVEEKPTPKSALLPVIVPESHHEPVKESSKESPKELPKELPTLPKRPMPKKNRMKLYLTLAASVFMIAVAAVGLWYYYPRVVIDVIVATEPYQTKLTATVDTSKQFVNDATGKTLAGEHLEGTADSTKDTPTTGKKDVGTAATGVLALQNRLGQAVKLSSGTTALAGSVSFVTTAEVTIPAATVAIDAGGNVIVAPGTATVAVSASQPGESGNIAKGVTLVIQGQGSTVQDKVTALSNAAFTGGTSKQVNVVTQADLDKAKQLASDDATNAAKGKVSDSLAGQQLLDNASRSAVTAEELSAKVGDQVDSVNDKVTVKYEAFVFDASVFRDAIIAQINAAAPEGKMVVMTSNDQITTTATSADWSAGTLALASDVKTQLSPHIDPATIIPLVKGKRPAAARDALKTLTTIQNATLSVRPSWLPLLPSRTQAYQVQFVQSTPVTTTQ